MQGIRYANIGIVVFVVLACVGGALLGDDGDGPFHVVVLLALLAGLATYWVLDERAEKRQRRDQ